MLKVNWSDGGGWQRGVAVPQILEESRTAQGHWRPVLAVVCCGQDEIEDDDDGDDGGDDDDGDGDGDGDGDFDDNDDDVPLWGSL